MDGFNETENLIVIGATNLSDSLDSALLRSGWFDKKISINLPNKKSWKDIIEYYLSKV